MPYRRLNLRNRTVIMRSGTATIPRGGSRAVNPRQQSTSAVVAVAASSARQHQPIRNTADVLTPPAQPQNHHADHCNGAVNYIGRFTANNMTAYFAHDAVHYTGVHLRGQGGTDACFGPVTFLQHDTEPAGMNAYKEAFERARLQYAYIKDNEVKFTVPEPGPAWIQSARTDLETAKKLMDNVQQLVVAVDKTYVDHAMAQLEEGHE
uniref:Cauli_VI domain-containing protein n=1 Tax=Panagrellus redivivus TaxID=6233 RepID=A0A7E4WBY5_PANRE